MTFIDILPDDEIWDDFNDDEIIIEYPDIKDRTQVSIFCPDCGRGLKPVSIKLIVRTNSQNGSRFLGCPNYPRCKYTQALPQDIIMRLTGQKGLFDEMEDADG